MIAIFERKEIKYLITAKQHDDLIESFGDKMRPNAYGLTTVCNLYFDTPDYRLIRESIEKPLYKEKLRLRCYGVPTFESSAFIELKKKFEGIVYKRREKLSYYEAMEFLQNGVRPKTWSQIFEEIEWFLISYDELEPAMALFYDRFGYETEEEGDLRITFDNNLLFDKENLDLTLGPNGDHLLDEGQYIMEIKTSNPMPLWLTSALDKNGIYPGSYTKYGNAYLKLLKEGRIL